MDHDSFFVRNRFSNRSGRGSLIALALLIAMLFSLRVSADVDDMLLGFAGTAGSDRDDSGAGVALDGAGNVYVVGSFQETVDFDFGPGIANLTSAGGPDVFVTKYDASGSLLWARSLAGTTADSGTGIAVDGAGTVFVVGQFSNTADMDPGPNVFNLVSQGLLDIFVCALDSSGDFQWAVGAGASGDDFAHDIAVGQSNDIYIAGQFQGTVDFDPGPGAASLTSAGNVDALLWRLDSDGNYLWAGSMGGTAEDLTETVTVDNSGNVYAAGGFFGTADLDPTTSVSNATSVHQRDIFLCKLDASNNHQWSYAIGGFEFDTGFDVATDNGGNVYFTGAYSDSADFDPGPGTFTLVSSPGPFGDTFVLKLSPAGTFEWAVSMGSTGANHFPEQIAIDSTGSVLVAGYFDFTADFDPGPGEFLITSLGGRDGYVVKLDSSGAFQWAGAMGSLTSDVSVTSIAVGPDDVAFASGWFSRTVDLDPGPGNAEHTAVDRQDSFLVKLEPQALPVATADSVDATADQVLISTDGSTLLSLLDNDDDANSLAILTVTAFDATSALGAAVQVNADGAFVYDPTGVADLQALAPNESLADTFTYTVSDGTDSAVGTVTIVVFGKDTGLPLLTVPVLALLVLLLAVAGSLLQYNQPVDSAKHDEYQYQR